MMKINKRKKVMEIAYSLLVIMLLLAITFVALEVPRQYYSHSDEKLMKQVSISDYSVNVVNVEMDMSQKIDALRSEDSIISEGTKEFDEATINTFTNVLANEIDKMLDYGWEKYLMEVITDSNVVKQWGDIKVVRVIDNEIYSFELGVMAFRRSNSVKTDYGYGNMYDSGIFLFDYSTGKIFYMRAFVDEPLEDFGYYIKYQDYPDEEYYVDFDDDTSNIVVEGDPSGESYVDKLIDYYGVDMQMDCDAYISSTGIWASPFTIDEVSNSNFDAIYNYLHSNFNEVYD